MNSVEKTYKLKLDECVSLKRKIIASIEENSLNKFEALLGSYLTVYEWMEEHVDMLFNQIQDEDINMSSIAELEVGRLVGEEYQRFKKGTTSRAQLVNNVGSIIKNNSPTPIPPAYSQDESHRFKIDRNQDDYSKYDNEYILNEDNDEYINNNVSHHISHNNNNKKIKGLLELDLLDSSPEIKGKQTKQRVFNNNYSISQADELEEDLAEEDLNYMEKFASSGRKQQLSSGFGREQRQSDEEKARISLKYAGNVGKEKETPGPTVSQAPTGAQKPSQILAERMNKINKELEETRAGIFEEDAGFRNVEQYVEETKRKIVKIELYKRKYEYSMIDTVRSRNILKQDINLLQENYDSLCAKLERLNRDSEVSDMREIDRLKLDSRKLDEVYEKIGEENKKIIKDTNALKDMISLDVQDSSMIPSLHLLHTTDTLYDEKSVMIHSFKQDLKEARQPAQLDRLSRTQNGYNFIDTIVSGKYKSKYLR